jgi:hypothetical protein
LLFVGPDVELFEPCVFFGLLALVLATPDLMLQLLLATAVETRVAADANSAKFKTILEIRIVSSSVRESSR